MGRELVRYSEAFKRHVVDELERGAVRSHGEARERFGIRGATTINTWLRRYGKNHLLRRVVRVESVEDRDQVKALKGRIRDLERAVADAKVQETLAKAYFEIVCEQRGVTDVEALKKSIAEKLSREGPRAGEG